MGGGHAGKPLEMVLMRSMRWFREAYKNYCGSFGDYPTESETVSDMMEPPKIWTRSDAPVQSHPHWRGPEKKGTAN